MVFKFSALFVSIAINCFGSTAFLYKDVHIPSSDAAPYLIRFCTTRTLENGSLKSSLLKQLQAIFGIETLVETGTYLGNTTIKGAQIFDEVHTIELSPEIYTKAAQRLEPWNNVTVHLGDSVEILPDLLPTIHRCTLFYLDGHYSGNMTARGTLDTPILEELRAIKKAKKGSSILLIDDIRLFQDSCFPEKIQALHLGLETYPDLEEVIRAILAINPDYQICFLGDALLAFPRNAKVCVSPVVRSCALHRLEHLCMDLSEEDLKKADSVIGKAKQEEKEEIDIYYQTYSAFELNYGYRSYSCLWYALTLWEQGEKKKAESLLQQAASKSLLGWRVNQCIR